MSRFKGRRGTRQKRYGTRRYSFFEAMERLLSDPDGCFWTQWWDHRKEMICIGTRVCSFDLVTAWCYVNTANPEDVADGVSDEAVARVVGSPTRIVKMIRDAAKNPDTEWQALRKIIFERLEPAPGRATAMDD